MFAAFGLYLASVTFFLASLAIAIGLLPFYRTLGHWDKGDGFEIVCQLGLLLFSLFVFVSLMVWFSINTTGDALIIVAALAAILPLRSGWNLRNQLRKSARGPRSWMVETIPVLVHPFVTRRPMLVFDVVTLGVLLVYSLPLLIFYSD